MAGVSARSGSWASGTAPAFWSAWPTWCRTCWRRACGTSASSSSPRPATARETPGRSTTAWSRGRAARGAEWLRLGVVLGNARAERFWERRGFAETRKRGNLEMGKRVNTVRVMMKPLAGGTHAQYLSLIERDRPEAA